MKCDEALGVDGRSSFGAKTEEKTMSKSTEAHLMNLLNYSLNGEGDAPPYILYI